MAQKPLTKTQLVAALAEKMDADKKTATSALDAIVDVITEEVSKGGAVTLPGVGKIACRERPERMVRNPATGEQLKKDADKVVKMTIAKALKESVNSRRDRAAPGSRFRRYRRGNAGRGPEDGARVGGSSGTDGPLAVFGLCGVQGDACAGPWDGP